MPLLGLKYFEGALRWRIKGILLRYVHNVAVRIGALCFGLEARKVYRCAQSVDPMEYVGKKQT